MADDEQRVPATTETETTAPPTYTPCNPRVGRVYMGGQIVAVVSNNQIDVAFDGAIFRVTLNGCYLSGPPSQATELRFPIVESYILAKVERIVNDLIFVTMWATVGGVPNTNLNDFQNRTRATFRTSHREYVRRPSPRAFGPSDPRSFLPRAAQPPRLSAFPPLPTRDSEGDAKSLEDGPKALGDL